MKSRLISREMEALAAVRRLRGEGYGVNLRKEIGDVTGRKPSYATLYEVLGRLERDGLIEGRSGPSTPSRAGRPKYLYTITGDGQRAFSEALAAMQRFEPETAPVGEGATA